MVPVLERSPAHCPFWAVEPGELLIVVPRLPTPEKVGAVVWALIERSVTDDDLSTAVANAAEAIETHLTSSDEDYAPGGLRVTAGDVVIDPGCCVGLDEWRYWLDALDGRPVYLGHDPDVWLEDRGAVLRLRRDEDQFLPGELADQPGQYIDIPRDALPGLLEGVRQDLAGFLVALHQWAHDLVPEMADHLVLTVDRRLRVSAPLDG
ncbi:hypothetical protein JYK22_27335, partial [Nonomuraea sp. RK-328]|nr:hypothetical protein [Nonomuraea sp. RK-328]